MQPISPALEQGGTVRTGVEALFRHKRLFAGLFTFVVLLVGIYLITAHKQYRSEMKFLLENTRSNAIITPDRNATPAVAEITEQQLNSELEVLGSEDVLSAVADPDWSDSSPASRTPERIKLHDTRLLAFRKHLQLTPARKSNVIEVGYTAPTPVAATEALQRFSSAYLAHRKHLARPSGTSGFFTDEARRYQQDWEKANQQLVAFQQQNHLVSVPESQEALSKQIAADQEDLRANQASLAAVEQRIAESGRAIAQVPARQETQKHTILSQASVDQMRSLLVQLQNRRTELLTRYVPGDRLVVEVDREILDTTASLDAALAQKGTEDTTDVNPAWQQVSSSLVGERIEEKALRGRGRALEQALAALQTQLAGLQKLDIRFNSLEEQVDQARSNFELFSQKRDQAQIEDAMDERKLVNIAVAESPTVSFHPVSPKPLVNGALGLLTALFLAMGAVYFAESSRNTIASPRELEMISRRPVLATVPLRVAEREAVELSAARETSAAGMREPLAVSRIIPVMQNFQNANER